MKHTFIVFLVAIIGLGALYFAQTTSAPSTDETETQTETSDTVPTAETAGEETASVPENDGASAEVDVAADAALEPPSEVGTPEVVSDPPVPAPANEVNFDIAGVNFAFDVTEMRVKEGDVVTVNFVSDDGFHDWVVDEFSAATNKVRPGTPTSVTFVADKAGTYEYYCSVGSHRAQGMVGTLIVE